MNEKVKAAMQHPDKLGAGARKRENLSAADNAAAIWEEYKRGTLRSGSGQHVTNPAQAKAIIAQTSKGRK